MPRFKMDNSFYCGFLLLLLVNNINNGHCRTVNHHRKSALGHMVHSPETSDPKVKDTDDDLEKLSQGHHSVKRVLGENNMQDLWLEDFNNKDYLYEMQSDSAVDGESIQAQDTTERCPPPPTKVPSGGCSSKNCTSDQQCKNSGEKCCYNGCRYICMSAMPPPPFVDWQNEPPRRLRSGMSWLVPGPDEQEQVEPCSTSKLDDDEDALLCPHGFICYIQFPGNPSRGIPNIGHCVQENTHSNLKGSRQKFRIKTEEGTEDGWCVYKGIRRRNGEKFNYHKHPCECHDANITCKVGKD